MNKKIPEFRNIIKIALFPSSFLVLVPGGEDRQSRRHEHREQHSSSGRTIRSDASYAIAGWPCANLAYHSNSSREKGGGDERKRAANAFLRVSYHRVTKRVCHIIRSRETYLFPAIIFPILDNMRFSSFPLFPLKSTFRFVRIEDQMLSMLDKRRCSKKVESLRLGFTRGNLWNPRKKTFEDCWKFRIAE